MNGAVRIAVPNSEKATELIIKNPDIFKDYEVIKGKMDDVFMAVTGKKLSGGDVNDGSRQSYQKKQQTFFKDKAMFFTSLITPIILLILYTTFLGNVYKQSFLSAIPTGFELSEKLINAVVAGQLVSSLLAVCCVTVSFCSNMLMVQDKVSGARADLTVTPVKNQRLP